jgi:hypothetical protein
MPEIPLTNTYTTWLQVDLIASSQQSVAHTVAQEKMRATGVKHPLAMPRHHLKRVFSPSSHLLGLGVSWHRQTKQLQNRCKHAVTARSCLCVGPGCYVVPLLHVTPETLTTPGACHLHLLLPPTAVRFVNVPQRTSIDAAAF